MAGTASGSCKPQKFSIRLRWPRFKSQGHHLLPSCLASLSLCFYKIGKITARLALVLSTWQIPDASSNLLRRRGDSRKAHGPEESEWTQALTTASFHLCSSLLLHLSLPLLEGKYGSPSTHKFLCLNKYKLHSTKWVHTCILCCDLLYLQATRHLSCVTEFFSTKE